MQTNQLGLSHYSYSEITFYCLDALCGVFVLIELNWSARRCTSQKTFGRQPVRLEDTARALCAGSRSMSQIHSLSPLKSSPNGNLFQAWIPDFILDRITHWLHDGCCAQRAHAS
jgi:hypothetical protein